MEIFNSDLNFNLVYRVEISSRLNSKLLCKMTMQLHIKVSSGHTELKFQLGLANPRWNFNLGWKVQIFHIIDIFSYPGWKFGTTHARIPCLFSKKQQRWRLHKYFSNGLMTNVYKNLKVPWNSETAAPTLKKSNYMRVGEKV